MLMFLSFALFSTIIAVSVAAIAATVKAELPHIFRALAIDPAPLPSPRPSQERRVRVIPRAASPARIMLRAAA